VRADLCREAIRLARVLGTLLPAEDEVRALLALMLLHDARRTTRTTAEGEIVLLDEQDRSRWDAAQIREGLALAATALRSPDAGPYAIQASIAAEHARAARPGDTDWSRIAALYDRLLALRPLAGRRAEPRRPRSRCATAPRPVSACSRRCARAATSTATTSSGPPKRTCCGAWADAMRLPGSTGEPSPSSRPVRSDAY
jgi:hypothetical protein